MSVDIRRLKIGDRVLVEAIIRDIDRDDDDRPLLLQVGDKHDTVWIDDAYVFAQLCEGPKQEQSNDA